MPEGIHIINKFKIYKIKIIFENGLVGCRELLNRVSTVKFIHYVMDYSGTGSIGIYMSPLVSLFY
jgi:hypothetical protein